MPITTTPGQAPIIVLRDQFHGIIAEDTEFGIIYRLTDCCETIAQRTGSGTFECRSCRREVPGVYAKTAERSSRLSLVEQVRELLNECSAADRVECAVTVLHWLDTSRDHLP